MTSLSSPLPNIIYLYYGIRIDRSDILSEKGLVDLLEAVTTEVNDDIVLATCITECIYILSSCHFIGFKRTTTKLVDLMNEWEVDNQTIHRRKLLDVFKRFLPPSSRFLSDDMMKIVGFGRKLLID